MKKIPGSSILLILYGLKFNRGYGGYSFNGEARLVAIPFYFDGSIFFSIYSFHPGP